LRNKKTSTGEYLAFLSTMYEVDPDKLFDALIQAEVKKKSECGDLAIECRGKTRDKVMFLFLKDSEVLTQFSIFREFLLRSGHPIRDFMDTDMIRKFLARKAKRSLSLQIRDLRTGMVQINLKAKVLEIAKPCMVYTRYGNYASVANAVIADETGTIRLCLWNEQIGSVSTGDTIQIENARTSMFRGQRQLNIGKKGLLSSVNDSNSQVEKMISS